MRVIARTGSGAYLRTWARPPAPSHSGPNASAADSITPAATIALAMCGLPTTPPPAIELTCSQLTGAPSPASRSTIARARAIRCWRIFVHSAPSARSAESNR